MVDPKPAWDQLEDIAQGGTNETDKVHNYIVYLEDELTKKNMMLDDYLSRYEKAIHDAVMALNTVSFVSGYNEFN